MASCSTLGFIFLLGGSLDKPLSGSDSLQKQPGMKCPDAGTFFFFLLCFGVVYLAFHNSSSFCKAKEKRKAPGRVQVFISAEGISRAFAKPSWSTERLCLWLSVAESESVK